MFNVLNVLVNVGRIFNGREEKAVDDAGLIGIAFLLEQIFFYIIRVNLELVQRNVRLFAALVDD